MKSCIIWKPRQGAGVHTWLISLIWVRDMIKVEWGYFYGIMLRWTFIFVTLVSLCNVLCISWVLYAILINGVSVGYIRPGQGIRQGNILSPYQFFICAKVCLPYWDMLERRQYWVLSISREIFENFSLTYDSLLFCKAMMEEMSSYF